MSVDYKTQKEVNREEYIAEVKSDIESILKSYYEEGNTIAHTLDLLEEKGLYKSKRKDVEGYILGNNTHSDDMIDYIVDRMDLKPLTEEIFIHN